MNTLLYWDTLAFQFINGLHTPWLDSFFWIASQIPTWIPLYILCIILIIKKQKRKAWAIIPLMAITILCTDQSCNFIKRTVQRPRPSHNEQLANTIHLHEQSNGTYYYGGKYGYPSAHAANSMAFALLIIFFLTRKRRALSSILIVWSLILAYSRIYLGVHYPFDILTGLLLGTCWSILWILIYNKYFRKIFSKEDIDNEKIM